MHIHDCSHSWLGTGTSIRSGGVKLDLQAYTSPLSEMVQPCKSFPHVSFNFFFSVAQVKKVKLSSDKVSVSYSEKRHYKCDIIYGQNSRFGLVWFMVFSATFNNISVRSWLSVLLVEDTGVPGENHRHVASHRQTLSHNIVFSEPRLSGI